MIRTYHLSEDNSSSCALDYKSFPSLESISYPSDFAVKNMFQYIFNRGTRMEKMELIKYQDEYTRFCKSIKNMDPAFRETVYTMIGYMRDYKHGRGERDISYMMICVWYDEINHIQAFQMIRRWLGEDDSWMGGLGSWKDIKYLPKYVFSKYMTKDHPIIQYCVELAIERLMKDYLQLLILQNKQRVNDKNANDNDANDNISMVAKWLPRENSALHWLYELLVYEWTRHNMKYLLRGNDYRSASAQNKARYTFRKWVSQLNAHLGTKEIYECNAFMSDIDVSKISYKALWEISLSETRCNVSGLGIEKENGKTKYQENARFHILNFPKTLPLEEYVKKGCEILDAPFCDPPQISIINYLWKKQIESTETFHHTIIPFLNLHYDMDEVYTSLSNLDICKAIGVACFISQKSRMNKRIFLSQSSSLPFVMIDLSDCNNFMDMLREIRTYITLSTVPECRLESISESISHCVKIVADSILKTNMEANKVIPVFIHNHPQFSYNTSHIQSLMSNRPHIVFWNTSSALSDHTPANTSQIVYLTGTSPVNITYLSRLGITIDNHLTVCGYDIIYNILAPYS